MDEFLKYLSSSSWWLSVVVVGIILNLLTAYVKPALDRLGESVSSRWRVRSAARRAEHAREVTRLKSDRHEHLLTAIDALNGRIDGLFNTGVGLIAILLGVSLDISVLALIGALAIFSGTLRVSTSKRVYFIVRDARQAKQA